MRVGILTFHWAANYGAVMQCYALQTFLQKHGYDVEIINYKPARFDDTLFNYFHSHRFLHHSEYIKQLNKEKHIRPFREKHLNTSQRYHSQSQMKSLDNYDILISGSDQVLNFSFLRHGETGGSTAYYLDFGRSCMKRVMYAVSFGATSIPKEFIPKLQPITNRVNAISVRETSGISIFSALGRDDVVLVPDPVLLLTGHDYMHNLSIKQSTDRHGTFIYMLHNQGTRTVQYYRSHAEHSPRFPSKESVEEWLTAIANARYIVTNSFHCVVFSLLFHTPFMVVLEQSENIDMNDRFYTLLGKYRLQGRITTDRDFHVGLMTPPIDWNSVDMLIENDREKGVRFLLNNLGA